MPRLTPAAIARLAGYAHLLPDAARLARRNSEDAPLDLDWQAQEVYDAVPDLLETVQTQALEFHLLCNAVAAEKASREAERASHNAERAACVQFVADIEAAGAELRLALRLPDDAPFDDVLARARHLAELYAEDDGATVDEVAGV